MQCRGVSNVWHPNTASAQLRSCFHRNRKRRDTLTCSFIPDKQFAWKHLFIRFCQTCDLVVQFCRLAIKYALPAWLLLIAFGPSGRLWTLHACWSSFPKNPKFTPKIQKCSQKSKIFPEIQVASPKNHLSSSSKIHNKKRIHESIFPHKSSILF